ncbi:MAG TPA: hypothetical protein VHY79_20175, partial [Rhizomicrobium sp.]|nr:hypothetical protein [Rhizomicrobium sp.]
MTQFTRRRLFDSLPAIAVTAGSTRALSAPRSSTQFDDWPALARDVRSEMAWAWRNYVELAFGHDQIKPVSGGVEQFFFPN